METKLEQSSATNPNPVVSVGKDGTVLYSNAAGEPLLHEWGVGVGEILPSSIGDLVRRVISQNSPEKMEVKAGNRVYLISLHPLPEEECVNIYGFDISDQKELEEKLRESEEKYTSIFDKSPFAIALTRMPEGTIIGINDAFQRLFECTCEEVVGKNSIDLRITNEFSQAQVAKELDAKGFVHNFECTRTTMSGKQITLSLYLDWVSVNGHKHILTTIQDITERKKMEESLRQSEERLRLAQVSASAGIWDWDMSTYKLEWSEELFQLFGLDPRKTDASLDIWRSLLHPDDKLIAEKRIETAINNHTSLASEYRIVLPSGELRWINALGNAIYDKSWKPQRMLGICIDITERKQAEEGLKKANETLEEKVKERTAELEKAYNLLKVSEEKHRNIIETANEGIAIIDSKGIITYANKRLWDMLGYSTEESINKSAYDLVEDVAAFKKKQEERSKGVNDNYELKAVRKDGSKLWALANVKALFNEKGEYTGSLGMFTDITKRKEAEEKLRESEEKYRNIVETADEGIGVIDNEFKLTYVNKKLEEMIGYSTEELIGKSMWFFLSEESKPIVSLIFERGLQNFENPKLKYIRKDGSYLWAQTNAKPIFDNDGKFMCITTMLTDITKQKEAEEYLEKIEIVRKKEIHHRIKNNLQVISSLLDLQAAQFRNRKNIKDSEVLNAFRESQNRVVSMALIHEELYRGGEIDTLDFLEYIKELADNLCQTYRLGDADIRLNMDLEENTFFDMDTAIPLGMIVNELVSNSFKYAFTDRDRGEIQIKLQSDENKECKIEGCQSTSYTLTVSDNGVGIPENIDIENLDSLGLQLVISLVDQLDGELELKRDNGTEFTIRFTVTETNNQALETASQQLIKY